MEEEKRVIKEEELDLEVLDTGIDSQDIGTRNVCCRSTLFPVR